MTTKDVSDEYNKYYKDRDSETTNKNIDTLVDKFTNSDDDKAALKNYLKQASKMHVKDDGATHTPPVFTAKRDTTASFEQQWSGATRARFGFAVDRFMPYLAGGIAYTSVSGKSVSNDTATVETDKDTNSIIATPPLGVNGVKFTATKTLNDSQILLGFTVGAGFDFAITDNVLARAEYRYNDFGSKDFTFGETNKVKYALKDQDIRVGIAFKF